MYVCVCVCVCVWSLIIERLLLENTTLDELNMIFGLATFMRSLQQSQHKSICFSSEYLPIVEIFHQSLQIIKNP